LRPGDVLMLAIEDFRSTKFKTLMSSLGIIIGVIAIVVILSVGEGLYSGVSESFGDLQVNTIIIIPGALGFSTTGDMSDFGGTAQVEKPPAELTGRDVRIIENIIGVENVGPRVNWQGNMEFRGDARSVSVIGLLPHAEDVLASNVENGRFLMDNDRTGIVIGASLAEDAFSSPLRPGMQVTITNPYSQETENYRIVGVLKEAGGTFDLFGGSRDITVYMTSQGLQEVHKFGSYSQIVATVEDLDEVEEVQERIEEKLDVIHRNEEYTAIAQKSVLEIVDRIFAMILITLLGIGSISLIVGGIGIMNVMMLTVQERIKEIGVMKATGATRRDILTLFLTESGMLGLISGIVGVVLGVVFSLVVGSLGNLPVSITVPMMLIGLAFGLGTTLFAGIYPASRASKLDPIQALRSE